MKALIVCDDDSAIKKIDAALQECGYGTIIYRWLLKALDNMEEISPDVTVISVSDYPRHWKVLVQFINSGIGRNKNTILLYTPSVLADEEHKKAQMLEVTGFIHGLNEEAQELKDLCRSIEGARKTDSSETVSENTDCDCKIPSVDEVLSDGKDCAQTLRMTTERPRVSGAGLKKKCDEYIANHPLLQKERHSEENNSAAASKCLKQKDEETGEQSIPLDLSANDTKRECDICCSAGTDCCATAATEENNSCKNGTMKRWNSLLRHIHELYEK